MDRQIAPKGVAVHTRDIERGVDYGWHVKKGDPWLFDRIEEIFRIVLRDTGGETRKLALVVAEKRVGLLLCDMPSDRIDHGNRIIYDTLYMEFENIEASYLLEYIACLLICAPEEYKVVLDRATGYAEDLYSNRESESEPEPCRISCPETPMGETNPKFFGKWAITSSEPENFQRVSSYLKLLAGQAWIPSLFLFVSTGRKGLEACKQISDKYNQCLILTMSSDIKKDTSLKRRLTKEIVGKALKFILQSSR